MTYAAPMIIPPIDERLYLNAADSLLNCRKCGAPKQTRKIFRGQPELFYIHCDCERRAIEAYEQDLKRREAEHRLSTLRSGGFQDASSRKCTFAQDKGYSSKLQFCKAYVDQWEEAGTHGAGLVLWGPNGTGKTFAALCIANALIDKGIAVRITSFPEILSRITNIDFNEQDNYLRTFTGCSLLVLDDFGKERTTDYAYEKMFYILDTRYRLKKPTIVTTNLTLKALEYPADERTAALYQRILERNSPVFFDGPNIRSIITEENRKTQQKLLKG